MAIAQQTPEEIAAEALNHAADCVEELVEQGEPMGVRQTYRRAFRPGDRYIVEETNGGEDALDEFGEVVAEACANELEGEKAAQVYRINADEMTR